MRRILLGGLGIVLGTIARPAFSQENGTRAARVPTARAATLGVPVAATSPSQSEVTPAGLFNRKPIPDAPITGSSLETTTSAPIVIGVPPPAIGTPYTLPTPRSLSGPSLTEIRRPMAGGASSVPGGSIGMPVGMPTGIPTVGRSDSTVPSVFPNDCAVPGGCPTPAVNRLASCGSPRWWTSAEYLLWWTKSTQLPTLVTTSSPAYNGILGAGDTRSLLGGSFGPGVRSGVRIGAGWWLSDAQCNGIDTRFFWIFGQGSNAAFNTGQDPLLARPFFNVNSPYGPYSEIVGAPGLAMGGVQVHLDNSLWGAEINHRRYLLGNANGRIDTLVGFRYLNFTENLSITETFARSPGSDMAIGAPVLGGMVNDSFRAVNNFYGGQVGLTGETRFGRWFVNGRSTIAFGTVNQVATIGGGQGLISGPGAVGLYQGGLLALPGSNIGSFSQNRFAVLPEIGLNLGYFITPRLRTFVGYNFLYLSNVLRASGTIDQNLDASRIPNFPLANGAAPLPGTSHPVPQFNTTDFFVQGISFGLQYVW